MFSKFRLFLYSLILFCRRVLFQFCVQKAQFNFTAGSRKFRFSHKGSSDIKRYAAVGQRHSYLLPILNLNGAVLTPMFS